jgi:PAS domain S-box-containing protein
MVTGTEEQDNGGEHPTDSQAASGGSMGDEQERCVAEKGLSGFLESTDIIVTQVDGNGRFVYVNRAAAALLGLTRQDCIGLSAFDFTHPDDRERTQEAFARWIADRSRSVSFENRQVSRNGDVRELLWSINPQFGDRGDLNSVWSFATDITGHRQAERELRAHRENLERLVDERTQETRKAAHDLQAILDGFPGRVFLKDLDNRLLRVNQYVASLHGVSREALEGRSCFDVCPKNRAQECFDEEREMLRSNAPGLDHVEPWETPDGTLWMRTTKAPWTGPDGRVTGIICVSQDVTEQRRARDAAERRERITAAVNRVFREAILCETEEDLARTTLRVGEQLTGSRFGWVGVLNPAGLMDTVAISNPGWDACDVPVSDATKLIKNMPLRGIDRTTLKEGRPRIVNPGRMGTHPDRVGTPAGHPPVTCFLGMPFKEEERTIGMIALANKDGGYDDGDLEAVDAIAVAFREALARKRMERQVREAAAVKAIQAELSERMSGEHELAALSREIITFVCGRLEVPTGLLYVVEEDGTLRLAAGHAGGDWSAATARFRPGEGLVGQAALEKRQMVLAGLPETYCRIESGLGEARPRSVLVKPILHGGRVIGAFELGTHLAFGDAQTALLEALSGPVAAALLGATAHETRARLLDESQRLAGELQAQQEELRTLNEELEGQARALRSSEESLRVQQEELRVTNEELLQKNLLLERQKQEVEAARRKIVEQKEEVALASRYKSEFLANMSHELRTPLNSLLLLARSLSENKEGNLTGDQVESARIIYGAGTDLLNLINEILDLARIEAGRMELHWARVGTPVLAAAVERSFAHVARDKGLAFEVRIEVDSPAEITVDQRRLEQIVRNLVGNAIKFTETGGVTVSFGRPGSDLDRGDRGLDRDSALAVAVKDTGVGIAPEHHKVIFEAFQQADGGTSRRFGGTGLGLSISRELAQLLGGEISLRSEPGKGSTFTLLLPLEPADGSRKAPVRSTPRQVQAGPLASPAAMTAPPDAVPDDRASVTDGDKVILAIEDDVAFARMLSDACHARGFKCLIAVTGEEGLGLARRHLPRGIVLDLRLPGVDGWSVLGSLKEDTRTRHIPVHVVSAVDAVTETLRRGAVGHVTKPITREQLDGALERIESTASAAVKRVLVVEDDLQMRESVKALIGNGDVKLDEAGSGEGALLAMRSVAYSCVILDLGLPDMDGTELLSRLQAEGIELPPVIVHTARDLTESEEMELMQKTQSIVVKDVRSRERLLDEVSLFLHRVVDRMPETKRQMIRSLHETDELLQGRKVLIVDDDMRTVFALSRLLAARGIEPLKAANGIQALAMLDQDPEIALVLMDVMMPQMDGYEAMRQIRARKALRKLPVIALTAKAMPEDRRKCMEAGASDYLAKPLDPERLLSLLRVWLYR